MKIKTSLFGVLLCLFAQPALSDPIITYTVTNISGNTWEYEYTVDNSMAGGFAIEEFSIFFQLGLYENLVVSGSPADWDPLVLQPDPGIPDDGLADWLALALPVDVGEILNGFSVVFDWLGTGQPGDQIFDVIDPFSFDSLFSGITSLDDQDTGVPEPGTLGLFALALLFLTLTSRKRILLHQ